MLVPKVGNPPTGPSVWVVDDHRAAADAVAEIARELGSRARTFGTAEAALNAYQAERDGDRSPCAVLVTDLRLPGLDGVGLFQRMRETSPDLVGVVVTAYGSIDEAVKAVRAGTVDFLTKPLAVEKVEAVLRHAMALASLHSELGRVRAENQALLSAAHPAIVYKSAAMKSVLDEAQRAAASDATVLVLGESGTGKERVARAIHELSGRARQSFVAAHIAALSEGVLESELFGHEKGAFTGAANRHVGRFEQAHGATLFLDEIGDIDARTQVRLLRVLQERTITRVGGTQEIPVDVRLIAATHRDLETEVKEGRFRADLFYRLDVVRLVLPPLRSRRDDVPILLAHFLDRFSSRYGRPVPQMSSRVAEALLAYDWPGNVRELENVAERLVVMSAVGASVDDLPQRIARPSTTAPTEVLPPGDVDLTAFLEALEEEMLRRALERASGNKAQAARSLALSREAFRYKLGKYGLS